MFGRVLNTPLYSSAYHCRQSAQIIELCDKFISLCLYMSFMDWLQLEFYYLKKSSIKLIANNFKNEYKNKGKLSGKKPV